MRPPHRGVRAACGPLMGLPGSLAGSRGARAADTFTVAGAGSGSGFAVRYHDGGTDVTAAAVQGSYATGPLPPGTSRVLTTTVTIGKDVRPGTARPGPSRSPRAASRTPSPRS